MECPSCHAKLLYRQRGGNRCSKCKRPFALEPKVNRLKLHDLRFRKLIAALTNHGTFYYAPTQLWYAASRKAVTEQQRLPLGCGLVLALVLAYGVFYLVSALTLLRYGVLLSGLALLGGLWLLYIQRRRPLRRRLPREFNAFQREVIERWRQVYGVVPPGLITDQVLAGLPEQPRQPRAVLACPDREVLLSLRANRVPQTLQLGLLPIGGVLTPTEQQQLATLRAQPQLPLLLLHDASAEGCLLAERLPELLGFDSRRSIVDLGLRPRQVQQHKLLVLGAQPPFELLPRLQSLNPTRPVPLHADELSWLANGFYTPLAAVAPGRLVQLLQRALDRIAQPTPQPSPQRRAQAVGFMSWPGEV
jgi:hypothetical protein